MMQDSSWLGQEVFTGVTGHKDGLRGGGAHSNC